MTRQLAIGVVEINNGWNELLRQIGVWFERLNWNELSADRYSVVVVNRTLSHFERDRIDAYMREGGATIDNDGYVGDVATRSRFASAIAGGAPPFQELVILDVYRREQRLASAQHLGGCVALVEYKGGWLAHIPLAVASAMRACTSARRRFHSPGGHHPDEEVARIPVSGYHDVVEGALRWLHARRGLPFVHLWRFPGDQQDLFAYRIDSDYGTRANMLRLRDIADRSSIPLTFFLHVSAHVDDVDMFSQFDRHELSAHGFRHKTYRDYEANWGNIAEALHVMRAAGLQPRGFAAPTGRWNQNLDRALRDHGIEYSSEFTLDYDGLPFHPWANGSTSSVLQVPVHPISVGALARAGASENEMVAYFDAVTSRQLGRRMPAILYHHPMQEAWDVVESSLERARANGLNATTMGEYAIWWKRRNDVRFRAEYSPRELRIESRNRFGDVMLRFVDVDGREAFIATSGTYEVSDGSRDGRGGPHDVVNRSSEGDEANAAIVHATKQIVLSHPRYRPLKLPDDLLTIRRLTPSMIRHSIEDAVSRFRQ